jgi:hypothetical protein
MNKKNIIMVILMLVTLITSCGKSELPITPSKWVIDRVDIHTNGMAFYKANPIEHKDLNVNYTWFVDSIGKFNTGDTISFQLSH